MAKLLSYNHGNVGDTVKVQIEDHDGATKLVTGELVGIIRLAHLVRLWVRVGDRIMHAVNTDAATFSERARSGA
jgi:hypothetical protein